MGKQEAGQGRIFSACKGQDTRVYTCKPAPEKGCVVLKRHSIVGVAYLPKGA